MRRALLVGNDNYDHMKALGACVHDVERLAPLLYAHSDGSENFQVEKLVSSEQPITEASLNLRIKKFFNPEVSRAEVLCFYFAGHGAYDKFERSGYLVAQDGVEGNFGVPMERIIGYANRANAEHVIIILDCCHAGAIDKSFATGGLASPGEGVCILAAARDEESAKEVREGGVFTSLLAGAMEGGGANAVTGAVTVANLHSYVDGALGKYDQCPLFKGNISSWCTLRKTRPHVSAAVVMSIAEIFNHPDDEFDLDPSFEPTAEPKNDGNEAIFSSLQKMRAASLVEPVGEDHMYFAAMNRKSCRLTPLGAYYWMLVHRNRFSSD